MPKYKLRMNSEIYMKKFFLLEGKKFRENLLIKSTIIIYFSTLCMSHIKEKSHCLFLLSHTHTHTIFLSNYSLSFLLYFATLIKVSQILLDLCFLQTSLSNKSQTLLSLSLHYLPSDFFFLFLLISHSILQVFYSPIGRTVWAKAIKLFAAPIYL